MKGKVRFYKTNDYWSLKIKQADSVYDTENEPLGYQASDLIPALAAKYCKPHADIVGAGFDVYVPWQINMMHLGGTAWRVEPFYNHDQYMQDANYSLNADYIKQHPGCSLNTTPPNILDTAGPTPVNFSLYTGLVISIDDPDYGLLWTPHPLHQSPSWTIDQALLQCGKVTYRYWVNGRALKQDEWITLSPHYPIARLLVVNIKDIENKPEGIMTKLIDEPQMNQELADYLQEKYPPGRAKDSNIYKRMIAWFHSNGDQRKQKTCPFHRSKKNE